MSVQVTKRGDVFICVSNAARDLDWVDQVLGPALKEAGIGFDTTSTLSDQQYFIDALAEAIDHSRYTLFVLTLDWMKEGLGDLERALAQLQDPRGVKHHLIPLWLDDCPIPKSLKIYTKRDFRRKERQNLQIQVLIGTLLPTPTKVSEIPSTLSAKLLTWIWEHPVRTGLLALVLLVALSAMAGVPSAEGWQAVSRENLGGSAKWITRIGKTLFVMTSTNGGCNDPRDTGLWRSLDGGENWEQIPIRQLRISRQDNCDLASIEALVPSPLDPECIYAATSDAGLLVSKDNGSTWGLLKGDLPPVQLSSLGVTTSPERLYAIGHVSTAYGLYRTSLESTKCKMLVEDTKTDSPSEGLKWDRLDIPGLCKQKGYVSLPAAATAIGLVLVIGDVIYVAPSDNGDLNITPPGTDIYYSRDGGNCWQRIHDTDRGVNYSALAPIPNNRSEILFATWDRASLGRKIFRWNSETGREQFLGEMPLDVHHLFVERNGEYWYASTPLGLIYRGSIKQLENPTLLFGPFSIYTAFAFDSNDKDPLLLSGGRIFRRGTVGWWQGFLP